MKKTLVCLCLLLKTASVLAGDVSVTDAAAAAQSVARPNYGQIVTGSMRDDVINKDFVGDTSDLTGLRDKHGMGDLFTPGSNKANSCLSKNDPECLAVQLVYQGGANKPELDEAEKEEILKDYENTINQAGDLVGEAGSIVSTDTKCETVTTVIPGLSEIEVCDETTASLVTGTCSEGWTMDKTLFELYRCNKGEETTEVCQILRDVQSHTENRYSCVKDDGETQQNACAVPVTVDVEKRYPYQCTIEAEPPKTTTCIETLKIDVIPPCTSEQRITLDLTPFKDVGYSGTAPNMKANITYTCVDGVHVTVKIGARAMGTFTSAPSSFTKTNRIEFVFSIKVIRISNRDAYEITITNTDKGKGTRTVKGTMIIYKPKHQEIEIWEKACR